MAERFDAERALRALKLFQRTTVDYVVRRLLSDPDAVRHFLVADEMGLGKTMVARGVIARIIEALQDTVPRIDIVYVCSNGAIAKQNVARLNVIGGEQARVLPTRLTMLALELARAGGIKEKGVNFFSLTPGTSLDLKQGGGMKHERALILRLIWNLLQDRRAVASMLQGYAGKDGWRSTRRWMDAQPVEPQIAQRFQKAISKRPDLLEELEACAQCYKGLRQKDRDLNRWRETIVGELRTILARESAEALEPDLIVLDEFQRFTELLHGDSEAAELAHKLFDAVDPDGNQAKVLLLSATPYRMLSLREDDADVGDHYREFLDVLDFLFGERGAQVRAELETEMRRFRNALQTLPRGFDAAKDIKAGIEGTLRRVIARTERVPETADRDAMMQDIDVPVTVEAGDLIEARAVACVADAADAPGTVEYWKSVPYLLSFVRDYKLGQRLEHLKDAPPEALVDAIKGAKSAQIDKRAVEAYRAIPDNNGRMRALKKIAFQNDMAIRLWLPPSLPYFGPRTSASKLLIFSQWAMVPDAIAALLSYESERAMGMDQFGDAYSDAFRKQTQPLNFRKTKRKRRLTGLRTLPLVIPSPTLAKAVDPLTIFRSGEPVPDAPAMRVAAGKQLVPHAKMVKEKIRPQERGARLQKRADGRGDERRSARAETWEWACAAFIDQDYGAFRSWLARGGILSNEIREDGLENWVEHIDALKEASRSEHIIGQPESDRLLDHLTDLALGSPATCALRALHRIAPDLSYDDPTLLNAAVRVGRAFLGLFNQPESQALLRGKSNEFYWQSVLHHCVDNDLQSVLDEYVHVLLEAEGQTDASPADAVTVISKAIDEALSLKPARIEIKRYQARCGRIHTLKPFGMRGRFATRLVAKGQEDAAAQRTDTIRTAFNSPFRPFVLASTSIGQEGLDFHLYCHRLVHWNLPANPVDLEQREGRIHRYKNLAIRQNLAERFSQPQTMVGAGQDVWGQMFDTAQERAKRGGGLEPFWLLEGKTCIERYVLSLPYSRESSLMGWLRRSVAIYRLAFGQPRQDDLLAFLSKLNGSTEEIDMQALQISLRPHKQS